MTSPSNPAAGPVMTIDSTSIAATMIAALLAANSRPHRTAVIFLAIGPSAHSQRVTVPERTRCSPPRPCTRSTPSSSIPRQLPTSVSPPGCWIVTALPVKKQRSRNGSGQRRESTGEQFLPPPIEVVQNGQ